MSNVWFTSDTHFFHDNILNFERYYRDFDSVEEMNAVLVDNWNSVVRPRDLVWHLGDVCFGSPENMEIVRRLNGTKNLVLGNHDKFDIGVYAKYFRRIVGCLKKYEVWLTHIPVVDTQFYRAKANVHGHMHSKVMDDPRYINVSVERWGLTPISLDTIRKQLEEL